MNCTSCNSEIIPGSQFCGNCGSAILIESEPSIQNSVKTSVGFSKAIKLGLSKWKDYKGRSSRREYWWFYLFSWLALFGMGTLCTTGSIILLAGGPLVVGAVFIATALPLMLILSIVTIPLCVRRLHDINKSGYWLIAFFLLFLTFIFMDLSNNSIISSMPVFQPIIGIAWWLIWFCKKGDPDTNRFGHPPTYQHGS